MSSKEKQVLPVRLYYKTTVKETSGMNGVEIYNAVVFLTPIDSEQYIRTHISESLYDQMPCKLSTAFPYGGWMDLATGELYACSRWVREEKFNQDQLMGAIDGSYLYDFVEFDTSKCIPIYMITDDPVLFVSSFCKKHGKKIFGAEKSSVQKSRK